MLYYLIAVLCLTSGADAACRSVTVGPLQSIDECKAAYAEIQAGLAGIEGIRATPTKVSESSGFSSSGGGGMV